MTNNAHDMLLTALGIDGVAHRLAVDGQAVVGLALSVVPALQGLVEGYRINAHQHVANDVLARDYAAPVFAPATEPLAGPVPEALRPLRNGLVAAHPAQRRARGQSEDRRQAMASSLGPARVRDVGKTSG